MKCNVIPWEQPLSSPCPLLSPQSGESRGDGRKGVCGRLRRPHTPLVPLLPPPHAARQRGEGAKGVGRFAKMQTTPVNRYDSGWVKKSQPL